MKISLNVSLLVSSLLLFAGHCLATTETGDRGVSIAPGVSGQQVEEDLPSRNTRYLVQLTGDPRERLDYAKKLYSDQRLEEAVSSAGLGRSQPLLAALDAARNRLLLDALVRQKLEEMEPDLDALAKERYQADPERYKVRKKIKLAILFVGKRRGQGEGSAKVQIEKIEAELKKDPDNPNLFEDLAKKYSEDRWAAQGGANDKWLIAPLDMERSPAMVRAAFALETPGQMTDIVETEQGFAIGKLLAVTPELQLTFEGAKEGILQSLRGELAKSTRAQIQESLQAPADFALTDDAALKKMITLEQKSRGAESSDQ